MVTDHLPGTVVNSLPHKHSNHLHELSVDERSINFVMGGLLPLCIFIAYL